MFGNPHIDSFILTSLKMGMSEWVFPNSRLKYLNLSPIIHRKLVFFFLHKKPTETNTPLVIMNCQKMNLPINPFYSSLEKQKQATTFDHSSNKCPNCRQMKLFLIINHFDLYT